METSDPAQIAFRLAAVFALVAANAYFVAAEFALVGARRTRLAERAREGSRTAARALKALDHIDRYISSTQLGITLASLGLGWIGEPALARMIEGSFTLLPETIATVMTHTVAVAIAFAIITVLHIVLGELMPKAVALLYPERVSEWVILSLITFTWLMAIPIAVLNGTANRLLRLMRIRPPSSHERLHSPEEIRMLVEQSQEGGRLTREDARLLEGVFEFTEKTAEDVMTPRTEMKTIEGGATVEGAADAVAAARRSRYPVTGESLDDIVGVVHAKDILAALRRGPGAQVNSVMRPTLFVPGTREVEDVLADMKRLKSHLAVVLDEYGGTAGLVTMEDLLEEIVGPIFDEHDVASAEPPPAPGEAPLLDGALSLADFNQRFSAALSDSDYTTLGGWLFGEIGRLPVPGDRVESDGLRFEVAEMDGKRVKKVRVRGKEG